MTSGRTYNGDWDSTRFVPAAGGRSVHVVSAMLPIWGQTFFGGGLCILWSETVVQSISREVSGDTGLRPYGYRSRHLRQAQRYCNQPEQLNRAIPSRWKTSVAVLVNPSNASTAESTLREVPSRGQLVEQGLSLLQVERVEALGEPAIDRSEKIAGLIPLSLIAPEPCHAHRRPQLP